MSSLPAERGRVSNCLGCQAVFHGTRSRAMALRMVRSFRAAAMSATIFGLPAETGRSKKAFRMGLCRVATIAPMNRAALTAALPPPMKLLPRHWPDWRAKGANPASAAICFRSRRPSSGSFKGHEMHGHSLEPRCQGFQSLGVALGSECLARRKNSNVQAILRNADAHDDAFHDDPSLPKRAHLAAPAAIRVRWNNSRPRFSETRGVPHTRLSPQHGH